jgi:transaldolase
MDFFIDTANLDEIKEINGWGVLSGVTTNPTLAAKEGRNFHDLIKEIASIVDGPISAEAVCPDCEGILEESRELASLADNIVIKIPCTPDGLAATSVLNSEGIDVNMTLVFSANQALLAAHAGAAFVSPFVGRVDDAGNDGMVIIEEIMAVYNNYDIQTEVICASVRHAQHVVEAALIGCDIATIPYAVFHKMVKHPLTTMGIESFLQDWEKVKKFKK